MQITYDQHELDPTFHCDDFDELRMALLPPDVENGIKRKMYALRESLLAQTITGTPEERAQAADMQNFLRGKLAALEDMLTDSKEAQQQAKINQ